MKRILASLVLLVVMTSGQPAWAQEDGGTRPAMSTFLGDTGLWFVPTAEVAPSRAWSFSLYRTELDFNQGFTNVSFFPTTVGAGLGGRVEGFASLRPVTRIDRDLRPLFIATDSEAGGVVNAYPFVQKTFSDNDLGDLYVGVKVNLASQSRNAPVAVALRGTLKIPTADGDAGAGTGTLDNLWDIILSKETSRHIELSAYGGMILRDDPDIMNLSNGVRWGFGAGFGVRRSVRLITELFGEVPLDDAVYTAAAPRYGEDGSLPPTVSSVERDPTLHVGATWQHSKGLFVGVGGTYGIRLDTRSDLLSGANDTTLDRVSWQVRVGFHPGTKVYVPPPPPVAAAPPPPPVVVPPPPAPVVVAPLPVPPLPPNHLPTITVACNPCRVEVGKASNVSVTAVDEDGDLLLFHWTSPAGTTANPGSAQTSWTAPRHPGAVPVTVAVSDGHDVATRATLTMEVVAAPVAVTVTSFPDIQFELDDAELGPNVTPILDDAAMVIRANPAMRIEVQGHAGSLGTNAYNMWLGTQRANAVRDYLVRQGVPANRLSTVSYGEERPKYDNSREETRRLNRRVELHIVQ